VDQYVWTISKISRRGFAVWSAANGFPAPKRVPPRAGIGVNKIAAVVIAVGDGILHSSQGGRSSRRKNSLVITLAGSGTASSCGG
jgi:hypothetical protein